MGAMAVFPAHAGMSPPAGCSREAMPGFPRSRGDEPQHVQTWEEDEPFSPLTRG